MPDRPGYAGNLEDFVGTVIGYVDEDVGIEQRDLYPLLAVTPLAKDFLHGKEDLEAAASQDVSHFLLVSTLGVEG